MNYNCQSEDSKMTFWSIVAMPCPGGTDASPSPRQASETCPSSALPIHGYQTLPRPSHTAALFLPHTGLGRHSFPSW